VFVRLFVRSFVRSFVRFVRLRCFALLCVALRCFALLRFALHGSFVGWLLVARSFLLLHGRDRPLSACFLLLAACCMLRCLFVGGIDTIAHSHCRERAKFVGSCVRCAVCGVHTSWRTIKFLGVHCQQRGAGMTIKPSLFQCHQRPPSLVDGQS